MNSVLRTCVNKFSRHEFGCVPGKYVRILFNQPHTGKGYHKLMTKKYLLLCLVVCGQHISRKSRVSIPNARIIIFVY